MKSSTLSGARCILLAATLLSSQLSYSQIKATTECYPATAKSVGGVETFEREKYINLAGTTREAEMFTTPEQAKYMFEDLEIKFGRSLGLVGAEHKYNKSLREDPARPGYTDLEHLRNTIKPNISNSEYFKGIFGENERIALHDARDIYPPYIPQFNATKNKEHYNDFPINSDAGGELVANVLKYKFDDYTRPKFYEAVNEPHWQSWGDMRFVKMHTDIKRHVDLLGLDIAVGGPCLSVSNFYANNYSSIRNLTRFIDDSEFKLDFYSFHTYDYYTWDRESKEFAGQINSGAPLEGVLDALASHTYNKYGRELKYVATEHGGYMPGKSYGRPKEGDIRKEAFDYYAEKYFPGKGFKYEVERRSIDNFLMISSVISNTMVFMNQPHIVSKAVPFILLDTSSWDPYYYSTLLVRDNFEKGNPSSVISPLIYVYEFFKGVEGEITHSWCDSGDLQHLAYSNENGVILLYHNVSNEEGEVKINLNDFDQKIKSARIRRVGREVESYKPYLSEEKMKNFESFTIGAQESVAIFLNTKEPLEVKQRLNERPFYATEQIVQFKGAHTFSLAVEDAAKVESASLRVGINRKNKVQEGIIIKLNGVELKSETELSADRYTGNQGYTTTRVFHLPKGVVKGENTIEVSFKDGGEGGVGAVVVRAAYL